MLTPSEAERNFAGDAAESNFPAADVHKKQQMLSDQPMLRHSLNRSKVRGCCDVLLGFDELLPVAAFPAFRVGNNPVAFRIFRMVVAETS